MVSGGGAGPARMKSGSSRLFTTSSDVPPDILTATLMLAAMVVMMLLVNTAPAAPCMSAATHIVKPEAAPPHRLLAKRLGRLDLRASAGEVAGERQRDPLVDLPLEPRVAELFGLIEEVERCLRVARVHRDHAAEDCRTSIVRNVPLHREILREWTDHGQTIG